ncbi:hypothetical protein KSP39_PZI003187 [Platanthera zijinensis]|uniref:Uncharacterized protein n=1 Tax=Platanthera zijinensis TaxID=2320716 RepID=A0AAP0GD64_9ASPA
MPRFAEGGRKKAIGHLKEWSLFLEEGRHFWRRLSFLFQVRGSSLFLDEGRRFPYCWLSFLKEWSLFQIVAEYCFDEILLQEISTYVQIVAFLYILGVCVGILHPVYKFGGHLEIFEGLKQR